MTFEVPLDVVVELARAISEGEITQGLALDLLEQMSSPAPEPVRTKGRTS